MAVSATPMGEFGTCAGEHGGVRVWPNTPRKFSKDTFLFAPPTIASRTTHAEAPKPPLDLIYNVLYKDAEEIEQPIVFLE